MKPTPSNFLTYQVINSQVTEDRRAKSPRIFSSWHNFLVRTGSNFQEFVHVVWTKKKNKHFKLIKDDNIVKSAWLDFLFWFFFFFCQKKCLVGLEVGLPPKSKPLASRQSPGTWVTQNSSLSVHCFFNPNTTTKHE